MKKYNIPILVSLALMIVFVIIAYRQFAEIEKRKKENDVLTTKLLKNEKRIQNLLDSNVLALNQNIAANIKVTEYAIKMKEVLEKCDCDTKLSNDVFKNIIENSEKAATAGVKLNDLPTYEQATKLEQEGFIALSTKNFKVALDKFSQAEKISPSFHMAYEISNLLRKEQDNFEDARSQKKN